MHHMRRGAQRDAGEVQAKLLAHAQIHLVVHQPQGDLRNLRWKLFDLDAVKLIDVDANQLVHIHALLAGGIAGAQHFQLQQAQLAVTDHQKISAAAGRVKKRQRSQLFMKFKQLVFVALDLGKLGPQLLQKQGLDELEDVFLRRVVRAQIAARLVVHDALEQAAEKWPG